VALDPFYTDRFELARDVTWAQVFSGDAAAIDKSIAFGQSTGTYQTPLEVTIVDTEAPGPHGRVPVRTYAGAMAVEAPCLVWIHGGAFKFGDLDMLEAHAVSAEIAHRLPGVVVSVDYRLVPKFRYPVPVDDCVAVVRWVVEHPEVVGVDPARLAIGGASAGSNLATATALRLRDEHGPAVQAMCLAYPAVHREVPEPSRECAEAAALLPPLARFTKEARQEIYEDYLGELYADPPGYGTPAIADLAGLPPVAIANAEYDDLRPSGEDFARRLRAHGVVVDDWTEPGVAHGYLNYVGDVGGAGHTLDRFVRHLRAHLT
jgi:acetyl esterase/lipase